MLISDYLKRTASDLEADITPKVAALVDAVGRDWQGYRARTATEKATLRASVIDARNLFQSNADRLIEASSQKEYDSSRCFL